MLYNILTIAVRTPNEWHSHTNLTIKQVHNIFSKEFVKSIEQKEYYSLLLIDYKRETSAAFYNLSSLMTYTDEYRGRGDLNIVYNTQKYLFLCTTFNY